MRVLLVGEVSDVELVVRPALACGYMSGALKHFFDQIYYPCLDATVGRPCGLYVHGGNDVEGAVRSVDRIVGIGGQQREHAWELGGLVAASVAGLV